MSSENSASEKAAKTTAVPRLVGVPPLAEETPVKAGPGQTVVTSPTGTKSVVEDEAVDSLKSQGYKIG